MLRCTIWTSSHDHTHPQHQSLSVQPHHITRHRNTSDHFLIITNYPATIPLHLPTSPPSRSAIPSPPSWSSHHNFRVPMNILEPWQLPWEPTLCLHDRAMHESRAWEMHTWGGVEFSSRCFRMMTISELEEGLKQMLINGMYLSKCFWSNDHHHQQYHYRHHHHGHHTIANITISSGLNGHTYTHNL